MLDDRDDAVYRYGLESGEALGSHVLDSLNSRPYGIWSDGVTTWVSNHDPKRLFAYRLPKREDAEAADEVVDLERVADEDFRRLSRAGNNSPRGIWSDGEVVYVADENDDKVYSYNMPDAIDARLASLELSRVGLRRVLAAAGGLCQRHHPARQHRDPDGHSGPTRRVSAALSLPDHDGDPANGYHVRLLPGREITVTVTSPDGSRMRTYRLLLGEEAGDAGPANDCLRGAVTVGFSLLVYGGGSAGDLEACAESRSVTALYVPHEGDYVPYILGAPEFANLPFGELYPDGLPALTPLIAKSEGPPSSAPASDDVPEFGRDCLRGAIASGFSLVLYEGGSVAELDACAQSREVTAVYVLHEGEYVPYILGAPEFANEEFVALFPDGVPPVTPLIAKSDGPPASEEGS